MLEEKLTELKKEFLENAALVESMIDKCTRGLINKDKAILQETIESDEPRANDFELRLDDMCTTLIAQFQPKAKQLRTILMILKMANDLERMGDHAVNIAESALFLIERPLVKPLIDTPKMAEETNRMLSDGIKAFMNEDAALAKDVCERDNIVDGLKDQILRELITYMSSDPSTIERAMHLMRVAGNLERIADLSTNVCEEVIFMVDGKVIKHHKEG